MICEEGLRRLSAAIVQSAVIDYRKESAKLRKLEERGARLRQTNRNEYERKVNRCIKEIESIEEFIKTPYFGLLCNLDPDALINILRKERNNDGCKNILKSGTTPE